MEAISEFIQTIEQGNRPKYLFFWGHKKLANGIISKSCFSQWYESAFELNGVMYKTAEHFMMAEKARLFNDVDIAEKILTVRTPGEAKKLGRKVLNFNDKLWKQKRFELVVKGNIAKFSYHHDLKKFLLNTGNRVLVEASPVDKIWGIGMAQDNPEIEMPEKWQGLNLLGFALMKTREALSQV